MKTRKANDLVVFTRAKDLCSYVILVTGSSPKRFRFTFTSRLQNLAMDVVEKLFRANAVWIEANDCQARAYRRSLQQDAITSLDMLDYLSELAAAHGALLNKQYEQIAKQSADCRNLIAAWINSDRKRWG